MTTNTTTTDENNPNLNTFHEAICASQLAKLTDLVVDISKHDWIVGDIIRESYIMSLKLIQQLRETPDTKDIDISDKLIMVSTILNINLEELVIHILETNNSGDTINSNKEADEETLDFITANENIDDYDRFIKDNKLEETISMLKKEV